MTGREAPQNLDAEEALLGAMLLSRAAIGEAAERLSGSDFYQPSHAAIFDAIIGLTLADPAATPDTTTVAEQLAKVNMLERAGGKAELLRLQAMTPASTNAGAYARIVADKATLRRLMAAASEIQTLAATDSGDVDEVVNAAESAIYQVGQRRIVDTITPVSTLASVVFGDVLERASAPKPRPIDHPRSGFFDLDEPLGGLRRQGLIVIAARPGQGKTALALDIARHVGVDQRKPVVFFSLEMGRTELMTRMLCASARVDSRVLTSGMVSPFVLRALDAATHDFAEAPMFIDDNSRVSLLEMGSKTRRVAQRHGRLGLIVVDYLQLMSASVGGKRAETRQTEVADLSRGLKVLAREMDCPVLALSQLNRAVEYRADKRPVLADLRESGSIEQDADVVMMLYRAEAYGEGETAGLTDVAIAKNRHGPTGRSQLVFRPDFTTFDNYTA